eukprot:1354805-Pleurochrysis_carterae.AAC.2
MQHAPDRLLLYCSSWVLRVVVGPLEEGALLNGVEGVAPPTSLVAGDVRLQRMDKRDDAVLVKTTVEDVVNWFAS